MKMLYAVLAPLSVLAVSFAHAQNAGTASGASTLIRPATASNNQSPTQTLLISRSGSRPPAKGPARNFTGNVRVDPLFSPPEPARTFGATVTFDAGARTNWHSHPLGQTLIVTAGHGRVQILGGPIEEIGVGDVVWIPPGAKHWHGATASSSMSHIAIVEKLNEKSTDWFEKVSDEQYNGAAKDSVTTQVASAAPSNSTTDFREK